MIISPKIFQLKRIKQNEKYLSAHFSFAFLRVKNRVGVRVRFWVSFKSVDLVELDFGQN